MCTNNWRFCISQLNILSTLTVIIEFDISILSISRKCHKQAIKSYVLLRLLCLSNVLNEILMGTIKNFWNFAQVYVIFIIIIALVKQFDTKMFFLHALLLWCIFSPLVEEADTDISNVLCTKSQLPVVISHFPSRLTMKMPGSRQI